MDNKVLIQMVGVLEVIALVSITSGCAVRLGSDSVPQVRSLNGVKQISPALVRGDDPASFGQMEYTLSDTSRLLIRYEELDSNVSNIQVTDGKKVEVQVTPTSDVSVMDAESRLSLCPLTRNWMMLATWNDAHPFNSEGRWQNPGGDFVAFDCVKGKASNQDIRFDVTTWFIDYPQGRRVNYGFVLITDAPVTIYGEQSQSRSPRILWTEPGGVVTFP